MGIGGAGMSAIARVLHDRGEVVTGSDQARSPFSESLEGLGVTASYEHKAANVEGADVILASAAIPQDNVELQRAHDLGIPVLRRDEFWPELTEGKRTLAVAGTHGKTTTTGLLAWILDQAGESPGFIVGGELVDFQVNARAGDGRFFVVEADEYQMAFLGLRPEVAVVTNVELDHPDQFSSQSAMLDAFQQFVEEVERTVILCADDPGAAEMKTAGRHRVTYGLNEDAAWRAEEIRPNGAGGSDFLVLRDGEMLGLVRTRLPGEHNVRNTLAALAAVDSVGISFAQARQALTGYHGVLRRFQVIGEVGGVTVVDDYAHHPTEIKATLRAARNRFPEATIYAVFQPHTYSRTLRFLAELAQAFDGADRVIVTPIYAAREQPDPAIDSRLLAERIDHPSVSFTAGLEEAAQMLLEQVEPGAVVITMSAGDGNRVSELLLEGLRKKRGSDNGQET
ncbi:MAG: UDP-N-acetylmuramate--L-alanine ligase [Anaerolineales bacterium]